jgi:bifunctional non-homologous end joining protein LigD
MLFKKRDAWARPTAEYDVLSALPDSVVAQPLGPVEQRQPRGASAAALPAAGAAGAPGVATDLPGALKVSPLPAALSPQLASSTDTPPARGEWLYELKFDGYRLLTRFDERGRPALHTRNGHDWTAKMKPLATALSALGLRNTWLDGEIVVMGADGLPDFNALQNAIDAGPSNRATIRYFLFDIPFHDGHDLRRVPLYARRAHLKSLLGERGEEGEEGVLRYSADFAASAASLLESARTLGLEGIIAKRADAPYVSQRSETWLKLKLAARQELVVGGFTERQGASREVGSLILGVYAADGLFEHAGSVGTGWDSAQAIELRKRLAKLEVAQAPFAAGSPDPGRWSRRASGSERWVKPELVAEVRFAGWTPAGHVRHAVFLGLREDKPARSITREPVALAGAAKSGGSGGDSASRIKVTHGERVIDAATGLTKLDLVRHYESVAERILPHLLGRPVSLVRGPEGVGGPLFFQKHDEAGSIPGLRQLDRKLWPEHAPLLEVNSVDALLAAAQMNVIEFHTWNSTVKKIDQPDRIVFDLDPGDGVSWERVRDAALLTRTLLEELGLQGWLKTSGGKGLHVVVPILPKLDYDTVKDFSEAIVIHLAKTIPSRFVAKSGPSNRVGKIFVDYLRNGHGATTACAFSARARPGLGVSMPVAWDDLPGLKSAAQWNVATAREHLSFVHTDPWADYFSAKQTLTAAMKLLGLAKQGSSR